MMAELMVETLGDDILCRLAGQLRQSYVENEPSGELLGICLVEQARRFAARVKQEREVIS